MSTPLTDSINTLTTYANETTGASDTTLSDAVGRLCEGYGGEIPSATPEGMKTYFEKQGFVFSDFVFSEVGSGYARISHNLGSVPTEIVAFRKTFESNYTDYQVGITCSGAINVDSIKNRTLCVLNREAHDKIGENNDVINGYIDTITTNKHYYKSIVLPSNKNFCRSATANAVDIRSQNSDFARPLLGEWWLGVR